MSSKCGECIACFRTGDCGVCAQCLTSQTCEKRICVNAALLGSPAKPVKPKKPKSRSISINQPIPGVDPNLERELMTALGERDGKRAYADVLRRNGINPMAMQLLAQSSSSSDSDDRLPSTSSRKPSIVVDEPVQPVKVKAPRKKVERPIKKARKSPKPSAPDEPLVDLVPRQCYGPECVYASRYGSDYCSDTCGVNQATFIIKHVLPNRLEEWRSTPVLADERADERMGVLKREMGMAHNKLDALLVEANKLDSWLTACAELLTYESDDDSDEEDAGDDTVITFMCGGGCGQMLNWKTAVKHTNRCAAKMETQMNYDGPNLTHNPHNMLCLAMNKQSKQFCRRLRAICPEHTKHEKPSDSAVCGAPKRQPTMNGQLIPMNVSVKNAANLREAVCCKRRKSCTQHFHWQHMARASIDHRRLQTYIKLDDCADELKRLQHAQSQRPNLMGLLQNMTVIHK